MILKICPVNIHRRNGHFQKIGEINKKGELVQIREFTLVMNFMIFPQK